ncbi:MAG: hypothetical protein K940chlam9_00383 [Chlamydiae bacterium]|nr:hypothetical protein [Chlamydiota bacterium]
MGKKNEKRLCWNCDGDVSYHLAQCPYCGVDLSQGKEREESPFDDFASPFQTAPTHDPASPLPPFGKIFGQEAVAISEEVEEEEIASEEDSSLTTRKEMIALLLLLPGAVFLLFALALLLFSHEGVLTLQWNQSFAYFYLIGAVPLLYLGWRAFR